MGLILQDPHTLCPSESLGKNTGVGFLVLLHGIFPTQGSNSCLLPKNHISAGVLLGPFWDERPIPESRCPDRF